MTARWLLVALALVLAGGCGEKITLPEAEGIPVVSDYFDITPGTLADEFEWVVDVELFGGTFAVCDSGSGRVVLIFDDGQINRNREPIEGLESPVALELEQERSLLLVVQGNAPGGYEVLGFDTRFELEFEEPLGPDVLSVSDVTSDGQFLYVGDPQARTVHRFAMAAAPGFGPLVRQGTMVAADPEQFDVFSPQVVSRPGGLATDAAGMIVVCDADTSRNWVLRYDPLAPPGSPEAAGSSVIFGPTREELAAGASAFPPSVRCGDVFSIEASTLGRAPSCDPEPDFQLGPRSEAGFFHSPAGVGIDGDGNLYVADRFNGRIQRFAPDGTFDSEFGRGLGSGDRELREPVRLAVWDGITNTNTGRVYIPGAHVAVVDASNGRLRIYDDSRWTPWAD